MGNFRQYDNSTDSGAVKGFDFDASGREFDSGMVPQSVRYVATVF